MVKLKSINGWPLTAAVETHISIAMIFLGLALSPDSVFKSWKGFFKNENDGYWISPKTRSVIFCIGGILCLIGFLKH